MTDTKFSGLPFAQGELYVVRSFEFTDSLFLEPEYLWRLRGRRGYYWKPGVNTAVCDRSLPCSDIGEEARIEPSCTCGFYGYWDTLHNEYQGRRNLLAVVKVHGIVTMGPFGVRASRAEIVALTLPWVYGPDSWHVGAWRGVEDHSLGPFRWDGFQAKYPNATMHDTVEDMLTAHPLSPRPCEVQEAYERATRPVTHIALHSSPPHHGMIWNDPVWNEAVNRAINAVHARKDRTVHQKGGTLHKVVFDVDGSEQPCSCDIGTDHTDTV